ncbi:MAG: type III pantothenate kinase [Nitrospirota bacterium]
MLLAIDIGNSTIVWGVFENQTLKGHWRLASVSSKTSDEYGVLFQSLLRAASFEPDLVTGVILSSVVPSLTPTFEQMAEAYFHRRVLVVSPDLDTGLRLCYTNPRELGSDRLVNAAAAYNRYKAALIIIDLGTATTFCAITQSGEYLGGVIAPGLGIAADALVSRTAQLPKVDLVAPKTVIGRDTVSSIQAGLIFGYTGLVDEIVSRMQAELGQPAMVIATGGLASFIAPESRTIREVRPFLTLEGLELLYRRTRGDD